MYRTKEQEAYAKLITGALEPGPPLLAGAAAGLGKTHGYTIPLVSSGKQVAICMSTRQLITQFMESDALKSALAIKSASVAVLRPRAEFENSKSYREHKEEVRSATIMLTTHAGALIDSFSPEYARLRDRDVVLFDEADLLADAADLRCSFSINAPGETDRDAILKRALNSDDEEERTAARAMRYALENPKPYKVVGFDEDQLVLRHRMPGRMLQPLVRDCRRVIFTSGTMQVNNRFDFFIRSLGIQSIDPASRHIDPKVHGSLTVEIEDSNLTDEQKAERILGAETPALVLTTSFEDTERLSKLLPSATVRARGEPLVEALNRTPSDGILIAAGAWTGLDSSLLRWKTVAISKAPYGPPVEVDGHQLTHYIDSTVCAIRRINQGLHRGLRTPDAKCRLLLLDPRCGRPELLAAIPARFNVKAWDEGRRSEVVLSKAERDPALRKAALKFHGEKCCDCGEVKLYKLDVHHLDPVSEGTRRTTVQDVVIVCANCHRERHHVMREQGIKN